MSSNLIVTVFHVEEECCRLWSVVALVDGQIVFGWFLWIIVWNNTPAGRWCCWSSCTSAGGFDSTGFLCFQDHVTDDQRRRSNQPMAFLGCHHVTSDQPGHCCHLHTTSSGLTNSKKKKKLKWNSFIDNYKNKLNIQIKILCFKNAEMAEESTKQLFHVRKSGIAFHSLLSFKRQWPSWFDQVESFPLSDR